MVIFFTLLGTLLRNRYICIVKYVCLQLQNEISVFFMILLSFASNHLSAQNNNSLLVKEHILSNGMTVWLNEDHSQPKVFGAVVVKAGAKDSPDTGIAHYFEHIMFKGTDKIGTIDYQKEKILLDAIALKYDELAATGNPKERLEIQKEINELSGQASEFVIPNEFNRLISQYGGTQLNAGTSYDYTVYMNTFSPEYMAQWAELNSERLINPVFRMFQTELETVYEEKICTMILRAEMLWINLWNAIFNLIPMPIPF